MNQGLDATIINLCPLSILDGELVRMDPQCITTI